MKDLSTRLYQRYSWKSSYFKESIEGVQKENYQWRTFSTTQNIHEKSKWRSPCWGSWIPLNTKKKRTNEVLELIGAQIEKKIERQVMARSVDTCSESVNT